MKDSTAIVRLSLAAALALACSLSACKPERSGTTTSPQASSPGAPGAPATPPFEAPAGPVTINATQGQDAPDAAAPTFGVAGLAFSRPEGWTIAAPGPMRAAELRHPGNEDAMIVFTHFGERGAGSVPDNLTRWARQVVDASNQPTLPELTEERRGDLKITIARHVGTYMSGTPGTPPVPKPDTLFFGAIIEGGPRGPVYVRAHAPRAFMAAHEEAVRAMFLGARPE